MRKRCSSSELFKLLLRDILFKRSRLMSSIAVSCGAELLVGTELSVKDMTNKTITYFRPCILLYYLVQ